ncbi:MAG: hypothetical protein ABSD73_10365 [Candidatus Bathyarchaeia archaeon]|jgi:hypothetical protein
MKKPRKTTEQSKELDTALFQGVLIELGEKSVEAIDQDYLQMMDECDEEWVQAWRKASQKQRHK